MGTYIALLQMKYVKVFPM